MRNKPIHHLTRILLIGLSGIFLFCALPPVYFGWLGWVALIPFIIAISDLKPLPGFLYGWLYGFIAKSLVFSWLWNITGFSIQHHLALGLFFCLYSGIWSMALTILPKNWQQLLLGPALWVILDYIMANMGFLSLSWGTLAQTQHQNIPLIQFAAQSGEYGVTFIVVLANMALARIILYRQYKLPALSFLLVVIVHGYGQLEISKPTSNNKVTISVVQPAFAPTARSNKQPNALGFQILEKLSLQATADNPDVILWPESSFNRWKQEPEIIKSIQDLSHRINTPILFGTSDGQKFYNPVTQLNTTQKLYNSAYLVKPDGSFSEPYNKSKLVPFAEYVPLKDTIPWPRWLVPEFDSMTAGTELKTFQVKPDFFIAPIICWENIFANHVRQVASEKPMVIAQLVNDNLFGYSATAYQHNLSSVFRAVENRTPVIVASNAGPSQIIDADGRVITQIPELFEQGIISATIPLNQTLTFYSRFGDIFILILSFLLIFFSLGAVFRNNAA